MLVIFVQPQGRFAKVVHLECCRLPVDRCIDLEYCLPLPGPVTTVGCRNEPPWV